MKQRNKKGFQNKIEKVAKKSLNSMSLMLNIIYSLPWKTGLVWQFFSISSSNWIFPHIYRCLINSEQHFFFWWIKITVSLVVRTSDLHHLLTLFAYRRSLDNLLVSGQAVGSSACLVEVVRMRAHMYYTIWLPASLSRWECVGKSKLLN